LTLCHWLCRLDGMQANAMPSKAAQTANSPKQRVSQRIHARPQYHKVLDSRKRPIRGLCANLFPDGRRRGQRRRGLPVREIGEVMFADSCRLVI